MGYILAYLRKKNKRTPSDAKELTKISKGFKFVRNYSTFSKYFLASISCGYIFQYDKFSVLSNDRTVQAP